MSEKETADSWTQQAKDNAAYLNKCGGQALSGLTIRDYFAGIALSSIAAEFSYQDAADNAYRYADAMLEARKS